MEPIILRPAVPAITLDDALLSMSTFPNGCDFRLLFQGRLALLEWGCYGVHINLVQGAQKALADWLNEAHGSRAIPLGHVKPETMIELKSRKPCQCCGGFRFKEAS